MYHGRRHADRIQDPMLACVHIELDQRHRDAARRRLVAEATAARPQGASALAALRRWLGAGLPAWRARTQPTAR